MHTEKNCKQRQNNSCWLVVDASGKALGRVASSVASLLRGKHKASFAPNLNCGDYVAVVNCKDAVLTGKKLENKVKFRHSGWVGGIKCETYKDLMSKKPSKAMQMAIKGMLPHTSLGFKMAKKLRVFDGPTHNLEAQKPKLYEI